MRRLTACARPHKDEFWFGYLMRLADMNGFGSVWEFESRIFYSGRPPKRHGGVLYPSNAARICRRLSGEPLFPDVKTLVERMTTYRHDAARLPVPEQARLLEYIKVRIRLSPHGAPVQGCAYLPCTRDPPQGPEGEPQHEAVTAPS